MEVTTKSSQEERLAKAMDLLQRSHDGMDSAPDPTWCREFYLLVGWHVILTDEGWEPGSGKEEYIAEAKKDAAEAGCPDDWEEWYAVADELNAPA